MLNLILRTANFVFEKRFGGNILQDLKLHKSLRNTPGAAKLLGKRTLYVDGRNYITCRREIFRDEVYRIPKPASTSPVIIDCGANIGLGLIYLKNIIPTAKIIAFEPDKANYDTLIENVRTHHLSDICVHQKAVWVDSSGVNFESKGTMDSQIKTHQTNNSIHIESIRLKDTLNQYERVYFLKIDIEGAENFVIEDCSENLNKCDFIFIEYHSIYNENQKLSKILKVLAENGFRYHIKETRTHRYPYFQKYELGEMEFQLNIFAYQL